MMARSQISLDPELHERARQRAAQLGISFAEYIRRLVAKDLAGPERVAEPSAVFDLGGSGTSDVARHKDAMVADAFADERKRRR